MYPSVIKGTSVVFLLFCARRVVAAVEEAPLRRRVGAALDTLAAVRPAVRRRSGRRARPPRCGRDGGSPHVRSLHTAGGSRTQPRQLHHTGHTHSSRGGRVDPGRRRPTSDAATQAPPREAKPTQRAPRRGGHGSPPGGLSPGAAARPEGSARTFPPLRDRWTRRGDRHIGRGPRPAVVLVVLGCSNQCGGAG